MGILGGIAILISTIALVLGILGTVGFGITVNEGSGLFSIYEATRTGPLVVAVLRCTNAALTTSSVLVRNGNTLELYYKCPDLQDTTCAVSSCSLAGTCVQTLAPGADCSMTEQCVSSLGPSYACNTTTCMCEEVISPLGYGSAGVPGNFDINADPLIKFTLGHSQTGIVQGDWLVSGNWVGGARVANAFEAGLQFEGVSFMDDTFTIVTPGIWRFGVQIQGAKANGAGGSVRTWAVAFRRNVSNAIVNQASVNVTAQGMIVFDSNDDTASLSASGEFDCLAGDTFKLFFMMSLPAAGALGDVNVYSATVWAQKYQTFL